MAIIKLQAIEETTYEEACIRASKLVVPNSEAYHKEIQKQIMKHDRSQLMSSINKSKKTWTEKGRKQGYKEGYRNGYDTGSVDYKITYLCAVCGKEIVMKPGANDHAAMKQLLKKGGWRHQRCIEQS